MPAIRYLGPSRRELRLGRRDELLGVVGGFITALALWIGIQGLENPSVGVFVAVSIIAIPGVVSMAVALRLRQRKLRLLEVWNTLEDERDVPVARLATLGGFGRDELLEGVARINRAAREAYLLDAERETLVDSRLRGRALVVDRCIGCGAPVNVSVEVGRADGVTCESCGSPVAGSSAALIDRVLAEVEAEGPATDDEAARRMRESLVGRADARLRAPSGAERSRDGKGVGFRELGCGLLFLIGMPFLLLSLMVGLIFLVPIVGGFALWEVIRQRFAPRSEREIQRALAAASALNSPSSDLRTGSGRPGG